MKQVFQKIESDYTIIELNKTLLALRHWLCYLENHNIQKVDKHLIKDLRRNYDRLLNLRKRQMIKENKNEQSIS